jgi:hypothetical protein
MNRADTIRRAIGHSPWNYETRIAGRAALDALLAENQRLCEVLLLLTDNTEAYLDLEKDGVRNYAESLRLCIAEARAALAAVREEDA